MKKQLLNPIYQAVGILAIAASPLLAQGPDKEMRKHGPHGKGMHDRMPGFTKLIAIIHPVGGSSVKGSVSFERAEGGVKVSAQVSGLTPNSKHGFHVHEFGDLGSPDATSAGDHFNPDGHQHALPDKDMRHAGDFGNLEADADGNAALELTVPNLRLGPSPHGILGRAVIIHAKEDDGGQPTGNAGDRIGAGVIGISKDGVPMKKEMGKRPDAPEGKPEVEAEGPDVEAEVEE